MVDDDTMRTANGSSLTISLNHLTMVTRKKYLTKITVLQINTNKGSCTMQKLQQ